jgi:hypothetical protein
LFKEAFEIRSYSLAPFSMLKIKTTKSLALCGLIVKNEDLIYYIWDFSLSLAVKFFQFDRLQE